MTFSTLEVTVEGPIGHVQLQRPEQFNTMNAAFWQDIAAVFAQIDTTTDVRCVVLSSTGKHFSAGLDLNYAAAELAPHEGDPARARLRLRRKIQGFQHSFSAIERCRVPVIAVVQGGCIGGGVDLIAACDMRVGSADCFFSVQEINLGMVADVGTLQRLPHLLPHGIVRELAYTGRRMPAEEAHHYGLLNALAPNHEEALAAGYALARDIAQKSPVAIEGIKHVLNRGQDCTLDHALDYVATWNAAMLLGDDLRESITAALQKRPTSFKDTVV